MCLKHGLVRCSFLNGTSGFVKFEFFFCFLIKNCSKMALLIVKVHTRPVRYDDMYLMTI